MKYLRTTVAAALLAAVALGAVACVQPDPGGGGSTTTTTTSTTTTTTTTVPDPFGIPNPPAIGTLKFFNAAGEQITGGNINDAPFATYVQSSAPGREGDTKATLFGYLPKNGIPFNGWSGTPLTASPNYPNGGAPEALASSPLPLVTVTSGDYTLAQLVESLPNTATDSYQGLYQLRVKTSGPGQPPGAEFARADIKIVGNTWTVVYPG
jgi:hypothetical protein